MSVSSQNFSIARLHNRFTLILNSGKGMTLFFLAVKQKVAKHQAGYSERGVVSQGGLRWNN